MNPIWNDMRRGRQAVVDQFVEKGSVSPLSYHDCVSEPGTDRSYGYVREWNGVYSRLEELMLGVGETVDGKCQITRTTQHSKEEIHAMVLKAQREL